MTSLSGIVKFLAVFFIVLGIVWFSSIRFRCEEISPRAVLTKGTSSGTSTLSDNPIKKVRSPYAKPYHDFLFWTIAVTEVFVTVFYVAAGIALLKRFVTAKFLVALVLGAHVLLQALVIGFMQFGAMPLSALTHNPNMLQLYFLPSGKLHNVFSALVTGFNFYSPGGCLYLAGAVVYFCLCFIVFSRPDVKNYLTPAKKV